MNNRRNTTLNGPDPIDAAVGARLRLRRRVLGVSQSKVAQALGITFQQVQKYERGANRISASVLVRTAAALETSAAALLGEGEAKDIPAPVLALLGLPGALDLIETWAKIPSGERRRAALNVVRALADIREPTTPADVDRQLAGIAAARRGAGY